MNKPNRCVFRHTCFLLYDDKVPYQRCQSRTSTVSKSYFNGVKVVLQQCKCIVFTCQNPVKNIEKTLVFSWKTAILAICCHTATYLPQLLTPYTTAIYVDLWQMVANIMKFSCARVSEVIRCLLCFSNDADASILVLFDKKSHEIVWHYSKIFLIFATSTQGY